MTSPTPIPQPIPSSPQAARASHQDSKEDDNAQKGGSAGRGHQPGSPSSPGGHTAPGVISDINPTPYPDPGRG